MAKIYIASSWRNSYQQDVVSFLRNKGHEVYDFRNPPHGNGGFQWSDIAAMDNRTIQRSSQSSDCTKRI